MEECVDDCSASLLSKFEWFSGRQARPVTIHRKPNNGTDRTPKYFRLRSKASGPNIVYFGGFKRPLIPPAKPFSNVFCFRRGPLRPPKSSISGPEAPEGRIPARKQYCIT